MLVIHSWLRWIVLLLGAAGRRTRPERRAHAAPVHPVDERRGRPLHHGARHPVAGRAGAVSVGEPVHDRGLSATWPAPCATGHSGSSWWSTRSAWWCRLVLAHIGRARLKRATESGQPPPHGADLLRALAARDAGHRFRGRPCRPDGRSSEDSCRDGSVTAVARPATRVPRMRVHHPRAQPSPAGARRRDRAPTPAATRRKADAFAARYGGVAQLSARLPSRDRRSRASTPWSSPCRRAFTWI